MVFLLHVTKKQGGSYIHECNHSKIKIEIAKIVEKKILKITHIEFEKRKLL